MCWNCDDDGFGWPRYLSTEVADAAAVVWLPEEAAAVVWLPEEAAAVWTSAGPVAVLAELSAADTHEALEWWEESW